MCDIIKFPPPEPPEPSERRTLGLPYAVESAIRLIQIAEDHLSGVSTRQSGRLGAASAVLAIMREELERELAAHSESAERDLREIVLTALGPNLKWGHVVGARKALELILACLPSDEGVQP